MRGSANIIYYSIYNVTHKRCSLLTNLTILGNVFTFNLNVQVFAEPEFDQVCCLNRRQ